ncbi:hypothetical protein IWQ60_008127 [Tieghemiomyces parasiticus]|uniref:FAD/NAD(P)-binding domain-containing protein n=1 Tax=Tieghemiomyces parasiticus TaxID=78921 RepID=A0A9W8DNQ8_9FUNG|nr:hypothetical protein IWQ60_008127 [Tieghemiomyces parasiticus]
MLYTIAAASLAAGLPLAYLLRNSLCTTMAPPTPAQPIRVVVIGASCAGSNAVIGLVRNFTQAQVHVTVIDKRGHAYYYPASPRGVVSKDFIPKIWVPLTHLFDKAKYDSSSLAPRHVVVQGTVSAVDAQTVTVAETGQVYAYDYLVVATGTTFASPYVQDVNDKAEGVQRAQRYTSALARARSVVVVGGGPTGIETAGEILHSYPDKKVTLIHGDDLLLSSALPEKFRWRLTQRARDFGIELVLNDRLDFQPEDVSQAGGPEERDDLPYPVRTFTTRAGKTIEADWLISAIGGKVETGYLDAWFNSADKGTPYAGLRDDKTHTIKVTDTLQLDHPDLKHIFVPGDANNFPCTKTAFRSNFQGQNVAKNLTVLINQRLSGKSSGTPKLSPYVDNINAMLVTLGPEAGVGIMPLGIIVGDWVVRKFKGSNMTLSRAYDSLNVTYPA